MKKRTIRFLKASAAAAIALLLLQGQALAMHVAEGYLPLGWCIFWSALYAPFLVWGISTVRRRTKGSAQLKMLLAMAGAFCFALSALKIPSVTGSSSHPTGVGLGVALFGPSSMALLGFIVLVFQAVLLAHGGLTTLGANSFSMAVAGPFAGFAVFALLKKAKAPLWLSIFGGAFVADLFTYIVTSLELALAFNTEATPFASSFAKFLAVFAVTQIPLAVVEGVVTVMAYNAIAALCKEEVGQLAEAKGL
jgi:cobalt/nickel transport system permease protein